MQKKQRAAIPPSDKGEKPMKYMIASDIHGSAYYCRKMMEALEKEQADRLILPGHSVSRSAKRSSERIRAQRSDSDAEQRKEPHL